MRGLTVKNLIQTLLILLMTGVSPVTASDEPTVRSAIRIVSSGDRAAIRRLTRYVPGSRVHGSRFTVHGSGVHGSRFGGSRFKVRGSGVAVWGSPRLAYVARLCGVVLGLRGLEVSQERDDVSEGGLCEFVVFLPDSL